MSLMLVLSYMMLLGGSALISPGVGFFGELIALLPNEMTELSHAPAYGLLTWLFATALHRRGWLFTHALFISMAAAGLFGLWMEMCQAFVPGRVVDSGDLIVNAIGISVAAFLTWWHPRSFQSIVAQQSYPKMS